TQSRKAPAGGGGECRSQASTCRRVGQGQPGGERNACSTGLGGQARGSGCVFSPCGRARLIPLGWSSRFLSFTCSAGSFFFRFSELFFCCVWVSSLTGSGTGGKG
ncbi:unnamed protein product, partial [Pylaiella littoralis]